MPIIALLGNKGGSGKTTLSINMACYLAQNYSTVLLDADRQQSSSQWHGIAEQITSLSVQNAAKNLLNHVEQAQAQHEFVVIDCPPSIEDKNSRIALQQSDWVFIPVLPSPIDIWANIKVEEAVLKEQNNNRKLQAMFIINQLESRTNLSKAIRVAMSELAIPVAKTAIKRRMAYPSSILEGKSVFHFGARGVEGSQEIQAILNETGLIK
jgi:chromosome partitioning protein